MRIALAGIRHCVFAAARAYPETEALLRKLMAGGEAPPVANNSNSPAAE